MRFNLRNRFMVPTLVLTVLGFGITIFIAQRQASSAVDKLTSPLLFSMVMNESEQSRF